MATDLQVLIKKLEGLSGPDRETDRLIGEATGSEMGLSGDIIGLGYPKFTASLDAAMALKDRVLPEYDWIIGHTNGGLTIHAQVGPGDQHFGETPALALLIALFRALAPQASEPAPEWECPTCDGQDIDCPACAAAVSRGFA